MAKETIKEQENAQAKVGQSVSAIDNFFKEYGKAIWICLAVVLVAVLAGLAINKFYIQPKKAEARAQMFPAEASFRAQQYELALHGDGNVLGFEQVIDEYGSKAGASAYLYAGECALQLGQFEEALGYLKKYNGKDAILAARALCCQGDAYVGLEKYSEALACFEKAASRIDNMYAATYLKKAGIVCEELGDNAKALSFYKQIKDKYPQSIEGYDIDKYISRINAE
ncbi:MAG: tetratricopeptide repeat protein [Bacteroidales bacterium]|nr:tetratricopeptide repeat protein [Bacteroidales bacterium]